MKLRRLATACFAALMAVATLATSASAAEGYVEYPGGENPSPKPRVVDYVAGNAEWSHGDGIDITKGKYVYSAAFLGDRILPGSLLLGYGLIPV